MNIQYCSDYGELSLRAKNIIFNEISKKPELLLAAATGNSPLNAYQSLRKEYELNPDLFAKLRILKPDEWGGIPMDNPQTCESFIHEHIIGPLQIGKDRYFTFESNPADPEEESSLMQLTLEQQGPIDLCILGIGKNGHIAFNEPAESMNFNFHIAQLSPESLQHPMAEAMGDKPHYGLTIGLGDIFKSKKVLLLITGKGKRDICDKLLSQKITTQLPASLLWLHPDVECLIDKGIWE